MDEDRVIAFRSYGHWAGGRNRYGPLLDRPVPIIYKIDTCQRTIRTTCSGHLTLQEVVEHFQELYADPSCPNQPLVFLDLREVKSLPESRQLSTVVGAMKKIRHRIQFDACAILASRDALFGMMRIFEAISEEVFRVTCTFRDAEQAEEWLEAQRPKSDRKPDQMG